MSSGRIGSGLFNANPLQDDAQSLVPDADYVRKGAYFYSITGVAITRMGNGDWFYAVDPTSAAVTVTLPAAGDEVGHHHFVKRVASSANAIKIVEASGAAVLDGSATHSISTQYDFRCYFSDGTAWRGTGPGGLYTPLPPIWLVTTSLTITPSAGSITTATGALSYLINGKKAEFTLTVVIVNNGTGTGLVTVSGLPWTNKTGITQAASGFESTSTGVALRAEIVGGSTAMNITKYDATYPAVSGSTLIINGVLQVD